MNNLLISFFNFICVKFNIILKSTHTNYQESMNIADHHLESSHSEQEQSPYEDHIELEEPKIDESIVNDEQNTQYESKQQELSNEALEPMRQSSSDQNTLSPDTGKGKYTESDEIYLSPMTNAKTVDTDNEQFRTVSKMSKASSRKSINSSTKNFIAENKKVKTSKIASYDSL